jgi:hypothetical protein
VSKTRNRAVGANPKRDSALAIADVAIIASVNGCAAATCEQPTAISKTCSPGSASAIVTPADPAPTGVAQRLVDAQIETCARAIYWCERDNRPSAFVREEKSNDQVPAPDIRLKLLKEKLGNGLVGQRPYDMGTKWIEALTQLASGKQVPNFVPTGLDVVT